MDKHGDLRTWSDRFGASRRLALISAFMLVAFLPVLMPSIPGDGLLSGQQQLASPDAQRPLPPLSGSEQVIRADWNVIPNPCLSQAPTDALRTLQQRYLCDRQRYFERGRRQHLNPTAERWPKLNPSLDLAVDYNRYIVSGAGLGVTFDDPALIVAGHLRLPSELAQTPASLGHRHACAVGVVCRFQIDSFDGAGQAVDHNDARFKARLFGSAIVDADVVGAGAGRYNVSYRPLDSGQYLVQVVLTSVEGEGAAPEFINRHAPFLVNDLVYQSGHLVEVDGEADSSTSLCSSADRSLGRWVYVDGGRCRAPYCTTAPGVTLRDVQINDPLGLNWNYVWTPVHCYYHLYSPLEFYQCSAQCGYGRYALSGDSLGREMLQNLQMLLTDFAPAFAMPKLKLGGPRWTNAIRFRGRGNFSIAFSMNDYSPQDDVAVLHLSNAHLLSTGAGVSEFLDDAFAQLDEFARNCRGNPRQRCFFYVNPAIQREADHSNHERLQRSFYRDVTRDRMSTLNAALRRFAVSLGLSILEGEMPTRARWTASWDGIHYSEMFDHYESGDPRWFGGASMMITQTLINALCNQPCNGRG